MENPPKSAELECVSRLQVSFKFLTAAASSATEPVAPRAAEEVEDLEVSNDLRSALAAYVLIQQVFEKVLSQEPVDTQYVVQTDEALKQLGVPSDVRSDLWLAAARCSAKLGKPEDVRVFFNLRLQRDLVVAERESAVADFLNVKLAWDGPAVGQPAADSRTSQFPTDRNTASNQVRAEQIEIVGRHASDCESLHVRNYAASGGELSTARQRLRVRCWRSSITLLRRQVHTKLRMIVKIGGPILKSLELTALYSRERTP